MLSCADPYFGGYATTIRLMMMALGEAIKLFGPVMMTTMAKFIMHVIRKLTISVVLAHMPCASRYCCCDHG